MADTPYHKFFQLNKIAKALGIKKDNMYNYWNKKYVSSVVTKEGDHQRIAKFMIPHTKKFFEALGINVTFNKP